jgi:diguanylate cyclase (GGDEF)-like protein
MPTDQSNQSPRTDAAPAVILRQRINLLYDALPLSLFGVSAGAILTVWLISRGAPNGVQSAWLATALALSACRLLGYLYFRRGAGDQAPERLRLTWALGGVVLNGLVWGSTSLLLFPAGDPEGQVVLAFVIAGITAGGVNAVSVFLLPSLLFTTLVLSPLIGRLWLSESALGSGVALACLLYALVLAFSAVRHNRTLIDSLQMRHAREQAEADIVRQAYHDPLTNLPNRRMLLEYLHQDLALARRHGHLGALVFLDLDRFKTVNDSLGHQIGDGLLQAAAARLRAEIKDGDTACRLGGDEFVLLFTELSKDPVDAAYLARQAAEQVRLALAEPYRIDGHDLHVSASIGIALYPSDGDDPDALLRAADTAMYRAKEAGRNAVRFFLPEMQAAAVARMELERALRLALTNNTLELHFQPQIDGAGRVIGAEALARWPGSGLTDVSPEEFVPVAEESGLVYAFGDWVLEQACAAMGAIRAAPGGTRIQRLAVNVSPRYFRRPSFAEDLEFLMHHHEVEPSAIELEITERTLVEDIEDTTAKMERLRAVGVRFAIDDFGTGYSSLAYLKRLPVDSLKIDRSFVRDLLSDASAAVIVTAILDLARHLGLKVVAEGVETPEAHAFLLGHRCDEFQGFLFHRPMTLPDFLSLIAAAPTGGQLRLSPTSSTG